MPLCHKRQRNGRSIHVSPLGVVIDGNCVVLLPVGFFEVEIALGVVTEVVPHQIVVEILGSDPMEAHHEGLQLAMVAVDVLDAKGAVRAAVGLQLQEVDFLLFREAHIAVQLVGTQHRIGSDATAEHARNTGNGCPAEVGNLGDGLAVTIDRTRHTDLF